MEKAPRWLTVSAAQDWCEVQPVGLNSEKLSL